MAKKPKNKLNGPSEENSLKITPILQGYLDEAKQARRGGMNNRDDKWEENTHLYWGRFDQSRKAGWQAREAMPECSTFVDRFAAAMKEALITGPSGFYSVEDPADKERDVTDAIKRMTDVWLTQVGHSANGYCLDFPAVFEEQLKLGAMMSCCSMVTWKNEGKYGRVAIETIDPRNVWLDHTYRNLYRVRRKEIDKHQLQDLVRMEDGKGRSIYNLQAIDQLTTSIAMDSQRQLEEVSGTGAMQTSTRQPITLDEYIGTVVAADGTVLARDALMVMANEKYLIRGPEDNPFWHGKDWLVHCPLISSPLSVYGRTYMEDFGQLAKTFNNLTNLILDAVQVASLKAYAVVPTLLTNPEQLAEGVWPNKTFFLEEGASAEQFIKAIDLGRLPPEAVTVWNSMKNELREAADMNEIGLGQLAPNSRTSATEINQTQESSSALIRSIAQTVESRYLNPTLDLVWKTGLQHCSKDDKAIAQAVGPELFGALFKHRKELISRPVTFQAKGISMLIQKGRMLRSIMQLMGYMAQSPELMQAFMQKVDIDKFTALLFHLSDIDMSKITVSERQRLMQQATQPLAQAQATAQEGAAAGPSEGAIGGEAEQLIAQLGIGQGNGNASAGYGQGG